MSRPLTTDPVVLAAGDVFAVMKDGRDRLALASGTRAVADQSWQVISGDRDAGTVQAGYEALQNAARRKAGAA